MAVPFHRLHQNRHSGRSRLPQIRSDASQITINAPRGEAMRLLIQIAALQVPFACRYGVPTACHLTAGDQIFDRRRQKEQISGGGCSSRTAAI